MHSREVSRASSASMRESQITRLSWRRLRTSLAYRTGDLARMMDDGSVLIRPCRLDDQDPRLQGRPRVCRVYDRLAAGRRGRGRPPVDQVRCSPGPVAHLLPDSPAQVAAKDERAWLHSVRDAAKRELLLIRCPRTDADTRAAVSDGDPQARPEEPSVPSPHTARTARADTSNGRRVGTAAP